MSVKKLNKIESLMKCRKDSLLAKVEESPSETTSCNGYLLTGYRPAGIKATGALHGLFIWNVRGLLFDVPKGFAGISDRRETVQQKFYSSYCNSILS